MMVRLSRLRLSAWWLVGLFPFLASFPIVAASQRGSRESASQQQASVPASQQPNNPATQRANAVHPFSIISFFHL